MRVPLRQAAAAGVTIAAPRRGVILRPAVAVVVTRRPAVVIPRRVPDLLRPLLHPEEVRRPVDSAGDNVTGNRCRTLN